MDVLLSTSLGASSGDKGEHGALVAAVAKAFAGQQTGSALNAMTARVLFSEIINKFQCYNFMSFYSKFPMVVSNSPIL